MSRAIAVIMVVLVVFLLRVSRPVVLPVVLATFVVMLAWPLQARLERRLPGRVALGITIAAVLVGVALFIAGLTWCTDLVVEYLRARESEVALLRRRLAAAAARFGVEIPAAGAASAGGSAGGQSTFVQRSIQSAYTGAGLLVLALALVALGLAEVREFRRKVEERLSRRGGAKLLQTISEIALAFRRYFAAKSLTSALTGLTSGLLALLLGLDLAVVWGFVAFLLEYVPSVGSMLAVLPPTLFAFLQFDGVVRPLIVFLSFGTLQIVMGNIIDPRIEGHMLALSPVVVLLSIVLWGWIWGVPGALLGVPMTVALAIACEHFESTRWVSDLIRSPDARTVVPEKH